MLFLCCNFMFVSKARPFWIQRRGSKIPKRHGFGHALAQREK